MNEDEIRLLRMCEAEYGWDIDKFIELTRRVLPALISERDELKKSQSTRKENP